MNKDRGIIKWLPFENLANNKKIIDTILLEKAKIKKPVLSLEQQETLEEKIIEAFYEQISIILKFYKNGYIYTLNTKILHLDSNSKKILLENKKSILFNQIIDIKL